MSDKSVEQLIFELMQKLELTFNPAQFRLLSDAMEFSAEMHAPQKRDSGEPYIIHPVSVASILYDLGLDAKTLAAALLHDCIEDTPATEEQIEKRFGSEVCELVKAVTKLDKIQFNSKEEAQAENFRRMFMAMAKDIRVIIIKLADRLHNMRTLGFLSAGRQHAMATETLEIFAPLASRLGLSYLKCELEDLCLKVLDPDAYDRLARDVALKRAERQDLVTNICGILTAKLKELKIKGEVSGRPKHFYSIYKKMVINKRAFEQIYDLTAVRVIVENVRDCYEILGIIHTVWKPIPGRFKDYISVPKPNNYQSLHTTVMTEYGMPFEIQIRTYEMHKIAEFGIAAHWKYKENRTDGTDLDAKLEWLRGVMDVPSDTTTPQEFYESLKVDLFSGQVFVFTPRGDVVTLPEGSTPVDFAYSVHSEIGNRCVGAKINNKIVTLETKLKTGDYIEIITANNAKGPSRDWLRFVKTSQAKSKIRAFFKKELKEDNIKRGKELLEKEAKARGYTLSSLMVAKWLDIIMQRYSLSSMDDLYASVGYGGFTVTQILSKLIDFYKKEQNVVQPHKTDMSHAHAPKSGVIVKGHSDLLVRISKCCNPVPGDEIVGFISRGRGVAIHRKTCPNLKNVEDFRLIESHWTGENIKNFVVSLAIEARDNPSLLARITAAISDLKLSITNLYARTDRNNNAVISVSVSINSMSEFDTLIKRLSHVPYVDKVYRASVGQ